MQKILPDSSTFSELLTWWESIVVLIPSPDFDIVSFVQEFTVW